MQCENSTVVCWLKSVYVFHAMQRNKYTKLLKYNICVYLYLYNTNSVCVCVCLSRIGGQTAGPIMTKFGTYMRIDLGMVPT